MSTGDVAVDKLVEVTDAMLRHTSGMFAKDAAPLLERLTAKWAAVAIAHAEERAATTDPPTAADLNRLAATTTREDLAP